MLTLLNIEDFPPILLSTARVATNSVNAPPIPVKPRAISLHDNPAIFVMALVITFIADARINIATPALTRPFALYINNELLIALNAIHNSAKPTPTPTSPLLKSFHDSPAILTITSEITFKAADTSNIAAPALIRPFVSYMNNVLLIDLNAKQRPASPAPTPVSPFIISFQDKPAILVIAVANVLRATAMSKIDVPALINPFVSYINNVAFIDLNTAFNITNIVPIAAKDRAMSPVLSSAILCKERASIPIAPAIVIKVEAFIPTVKEERDSCTESKISLK